MAGAPDAPDAPRKKITSMSPPDVPKTPKKSKELPARLPHPVVRALVECFYDGQSQRIATDGRVRSNTKVNGISEEDLEKYGVLELFRRIKTIEDDIEKILTGQLSHYELYNKYLKKIPGMNPLLSAGLIANIGDISKYDNVGELGEYCYDKDTSVLTRSGFKNFEDVTYKDEIFTLNLQNNAIVYQKPIAMFKLHYKGKMVCFQGQAYNFLVAPEHEMYVKNRYGQNKFVPAINIYEQLSEHPKGHVELKKDGIWNPVEIEPQTFSLPVRGSREFIHPKSGVACCHDGVKQVKDVEINLWVKFLGWYLTEGSCDEHGRRKQARVQIGQTLVHPQNRKEIIEVVTQLGFSPYVSDESISFHSRALYEYLKQFGHAKDKFIPVEIKNLGSDKLQILVETMLKGDGDPANRYFSISKRMAEDFQEVAIKAGYASNLSDRGDGYRVTVVKRNKTPLINTKPILLDYDDFVYHIAVQDYHTIMVRRNGKATWSSSMTNLSSFNRVLKDLVIPLYKDMLVFRSDLKNN